MEKLSVVIPAYNEEHRIGATLKDVGAFMAKQPFDYEILVVIDGAKDSTSKVVNDLKLQIPKLAVLDNKENHGKGYVVKQGMLAATGDVRVFMDADNSTKVDEVMAFLPEFEKGYDLVLGSRRIQGSNIVVKQPWIRDFLGGVFRLIVHTLVPIGVTDSQCGFKAMTAKAAETIFPKQTIYRWAFDVEILALARKNNLKIKEMPVRWHDDAGSQMRLKGMIDMLFEVLTVRWNLWTGKYK